MPIEVESRRKKLATIDRAWPGSLLCDVTTRQTVVLLDYETNADIDDLSSPLSHAALRFPA